MIVGSATHNVVVRAGVDNVLDGTMFIASYAGQSTKTDEVKAAIKAKLAEIAAVPFTEVSEDLVAINHLVSSVASIAATAAPDHKHYLLNTGDRYQITPGHVYKLIGEENMAWGIKDSQAALAEFDANNREFNWVAVAGENDAITLEHRFVEAQAEAAAFAATAPAVLPEVTMSATHGKVTVDGKDYTMTKVSENAADAETTGISEIVAAGENGAKVIYDLQGRRVNRASKGIFIVNGVKTLVK